MSQFSLQDKPSLFVVALPIGNPHDLSFRAKETLEFVDVIFCEDKRKYLEFARRANIVVSDRQHLEPLPGDTDRENDWDFIFQKHSSIKKWALVSDAGSPIVNDPGLSLLRYVRSKSWNVISIPGPSAPIAAWQWSGGFGLPYYFAGFTPKAKRSEAKELYDFFSALKFTSTFCFFDTRHQFETTYEHLLNTGHANRAAYIAREMTKAHEQLHEGTLESVGAEILKKMENENRSGELTIILQGERMSISEIPKGMVGMDELISFRNAPPKVASKMAADWLKLSLKDVYDKMVEKSKC